MRLSHVGKAGAEKPAPTNAMQFPDFISPINVSGILLKVSMCGEFLEN